jgi:hypothetical protein
LDFGKAVRASRLSRKLTQAEVATLAGVSRQAIVLLESNGGRVATLLAVQPYALVKLQGLPPGKTFGERIRIARGPRSIHDVAASAGISTNTVRALERDGGTVRCLSHLLNSLAPNASVVPVFDRTRGFKTVGGRGNPNRTIQDYYATPAPIVRILLDQETFEGSILEPAVGDARVVEQVLKERGYTNVTCFDLAGEGEEKRDFFDITERFSSIVTNPPFGQHVAFIKHAKHIAEKKIAFLLLLNYLTGKQRHAEIWEDRIFPLARVMVLNRGVNFLVGDPFAEHIQPSQLYLAWFIFERAHEGPPVLSWIDSHALIERRPAAMASQ